MLVVTHGGVLHAVHHHVRGYGCKTKMVNCAINVVRVEADKWVILEWNNSKHLSDAGAVSAGFGGGTTEA